MSQDNNNESLVELGVIGSILIDSRCFEEDVLGRISAEDFSSMFCKECFAIITELYESGYDIDPLILADRLSVKYTNARNTIANIIDTTPTAANIGLYIKELKAQSKKRQLMQVGMELMNQSSAQSWQEITAIATKSISDITEEDDESTIINGMSWQKDFMAEELHIVENPEDAYVRTRYNDLDNILGGGMVKGGLYVIGARPGVGKTTMALNIAEQVARRGVNVLFISLEMSSRQIMCKRVSSECGIEYTKLMSGRLNENEQRTMRDCVMELAKRPMFCNKKVGLNVLDILSLCKQIKGLQLLIVDYIGLIRPIKATDNRYNDYTQISGDLKQMAMMLDIPIVGLSQLNRENTKRNDKKPTLADLRDTGAIEQDADAVIFLHRDNYCNNNAEQDEKIELIVAKNRHGKVGTVTMAWDGNTGGIYSIDGRTDNQAPPPQPPMPQQEITDEDLPF